MEDVEKIKKDFAVNTFNKNSDHWVDITYINNPHHFYTRLTKYRRLVQKIETLKSVTKLSSAGMYDIVLFNLKKDSDVPKYARGQILYFENDGDTLKCDIFAIDYGYFKKNVAFDHLWECDKLFLNIPPLAMNCQLAKCMPKGGTDWGEAIEAFKYFVGNERAKMIIVDQMLNNLIVILYNTNPEDIATLLAITEYTTLGYVHNAINNIEITSISKSITYYNFNKLKTNDLLHVRVLSGQTLKAFYVAEVDDYTKYLKECDNITYYSKKEPIVDEDCIQSGNLICVKDDLNKYSRGIVKEKLNNSKALVHLVDLGKDEEVNFMNMRKMPNQCVTMPVVAIYCAAEENQAWDNGLHRFLYPGFEFVIAIKEPGYQFESPNIVTMLPLDTYTGKKPRKKRY